MEIYAAVHFTTGLFPTQNQILKKSHFKKKENIYLNIAKKAN
jgi:hypothetical protein